MDKEIIAVFLEEAVDILSVWEKECLKIERDPQHASYDELFRCAHNLKGSAKSVELDDLSDFIHEVEDIINFLRNDEIQIVPKILEFLLDCQSLLLSWIEGLEKDLNYRANPKILKMKVDAIKEYAKRKQMGEQIELKDFGTLAVELGMASPKQVDKAINIQKRKIGEIMVAEKMLQEDEVKKIIKKQESQRQQSGLPKTDESIRISANKIDKLIQLIGELSIHQSIITHSKKTGNLDSSVCHNAINLASKINNEIQTRALSLRMVSIENLLQRLERIIRDLARKQNKKVDVTIAGTHLELDKSIIEKVTDPLIHIVRNAVDHGIESLEERKKQKKDSTAQVSIEAIQDATGIVISIVDDGKGLDVEKIRKKSIEMGLCHKEDNLTEKEIYQFIFAQGFSTVDQVTDLSGRGVGMDVVKQTISSVGGAIDIYSRSKKGCTFAISLPTSLSIIDALLVKVDGYRYIVPLLELSEVLDLNSYKLESTSSGETMFNLRGKIVPVERLNDYFPLDKSMTRKEDDEDNIIDEDRLVRSALIIEIGKNKVAFEVDKIMGQQQVVVKPLNDKLSSLPGYNGGSIMSDGEAGMIITLRTLAHKYLEQYQVS